MKNILLVGCGADIGATLLQMNKPDIDGFSISGILTNEIPSDPKNPNLNSIDSLYARIVLANPCMLDEITINKKEQTLQIYGRQIQVYWGDALHFDLSQIKQSFNLAILATSKKHIGDPNIMGRFLEKADFVIGVAEGAKLPAIYSNLIGINERFMQKNQTPINDNRCFVVGSCQSNGWHAQLRPLIDFASGFEHFSLKSAEVDIIHPDTPTGRLGTKSVEARSQDPRDNLRPSFSQIQMAMKSLFPSTHCLNTISLRVLTQPPGYQITRFFFNYKTEDNKQLKAEDFASFFSNFSKKNPKTFRFQDIPLGSRGFEQADSSAITLASSNYFKFFDNPYELPDNKVSQLVMQSYVNNVRGYCRSVLQVASHLLYSETPKCYMPNEI